MAVGTILSCHAGIVTAAEISEGDANSCVRLQRVSRSSKLRRGDRGSSGGPPVATDLEAKGTARDSRPADRFREALTPTLRVVPPVGGQSADPVAAVVRNLLKGDAGVQTSEMQACRLLARVADAMLEGLTVCDPSGTVVYVNTSLCRMLGMTPAEVIDRSATEFFAGIFARYVQLTARPADAQRCERFEGEWYNKSGSSTVVVRVTVHNIEDSGGASVGFFAVVRDFTGRTRAETALRRSESELRLLSAQLQAAQDTERRRIARGLLDGGSQALGGRKFALESCVERLTSENTLASAQNMRQLIGKVQGVIEDVGRIAMDLHPSVLDHLGIGPTIDWFCRESSANYAHVRLHCEVDVVEGEIAARVKTAIYRIIQESFNNAVTHAQASNVTLSLKHNRGHVELIVGDDGMGFDPTQFKSVDKVGRGLGLVSMRERAEATAGRFRLESRCGHGTTVRVTWPGHSSRLEHAASAAIGLPAMPTSQA
jgi:PAS domain S-box-containing protein